MGPCADTAPSKFISSSVVGKGTAATTGTAYADDIDVVLTSGASYFKCCLKFGLFYFVHDSRQRSLWFSAGLTVVVTVSHNSINIVRTIYGPYHISVSTHFTICSFFFYNL